MPSSHLILWRPLLLLPPIPPSTRVFSNESTLCMRWPKYWSFSFSVIPSKEIPGLISFRMDWLDLYLGVNHWNSTQGQYSRSLFEDVNCTHKVRNKNSVERHSGSLIVVCTFTVAHLCPSLCDPMDCSPPGSYVHGMFQARILEWVAISSSKGSSQPRDQTPVFSDSCVSRWIFFTAEPPGKPLLISKELRCKSKLH